MSAEDMHAQDDRDGIAKLSLQQQESDLWILFMTVMMMQHVQLQECSPGGED